MARKKKKWLMVALILLAAAAACFGWRYSRGQTGLAYTSDARDGQIRVACVGDSITYGYGTDNWPYSSYPCQLQALLGDGYHVNNYGVGNQTVQNGMISSYRSRRAYGDSLTYEADIVVFMMGTNDSKPVHWTDGATFRSELETFLDSYSGARIILCTPATLHYPDGKTEGAANFHLYPAVVDEIAQITRQVAAQRGYPLVDVHELTAEHPEWYAGDRVHPNNQGAAAIAGAVYQAVVALDGP